MFIEQGKKKKKGIRRPGILRKVSSSDTSSAGLKQKQGSVSKSEQRVWMKGNLLLWWSDLLKSLFWFICSKWDKKTRGKLFLYSQMSSCMSTLSVWAKSEMSCEGAAAPAVLAASLDCQWLCSAFGPDLSSKLRQSYIHSDIEKMTILSQSNCSRVISNRTQKHLWSEVWGLTSSSGAISGFFCGNNIEHNMSPGSLKEHIPLPMIMYHHLSSSGFMVLSVKNFNLHPDTHSDWQMIDERSN